MHYYIDGYNLMFRVMRADDDLQKQRQDIIQDLEIKVNLLELDVTLVFDAQYQDSESSRSHVNRLEICFTSIGETADEFILHALKAERRPTLQTVVTSDKKLAWLSRRALAKTESVEEFITWLNRRYKNKLSENKKNKSKKNTAPPFPQTTKPKSSPKPPQTPDSHSPPEQCFDYYLNNFETEFLSITQEQAKKKEIKKSTSKTSRQKKRPQPTSKQDTDSLSNEARWRNAFERPIETGEEK